MSLVLGHRSTAGAHITMRSGGRGLMNVCYDRYDPKKPNGKGMKMKKETNKKVSRTRLA